MPVSPGFSLGGTAGGMASGMTPSMILEHIAMVRKGLEEERDAKESKKESKKQSRATIQLTPFQQLMAMASGGAGQGPDLSAYTQALAQSHAQEAQNQSDIGDWFSALSGNINQARKGDKRTSKKMRQEAKSFNRSLVGAQADKGVGYGLMLGGQSEGSYLRELNANTQSFDRRLANDAIAQGNYQKMVQARLGAQERAGIRDDMRAAAAQSQGDGWDRMMDVLGLMSPEQRDAYLTGGQVATGPEGTDFNNMRDALGESADTMFMDVKNPDTGDSYEAAKSNAFPQLLAQLRGAATSSGMDLNDPRVRAAFRAWVSGNFATRFNAANAEGMPDWFLQGNSFRQY